MIMKNEKWSGSPVLFILAGCYLLYLTWGLARDIMSGTVSDSRIITDSKTSTNYRFGIESGRLYLEEV